ncbi:MAG: hypothetical protein ACK48V_00840 [Crocinitomicaceae bacterium]|jgi:hypothetical protein
MKQYYHFILFTLFALLNFDCISQDNKSKDLVKLNKEYSKRSSIQMQTVYQGFSSYTSKDPVDTQYGIVKQQGENVYYQIGKLESLHNSECNVIVDEEDKMITLLKIVSKSESPDLEQVMGLVEKVTKNLNSVSLVTLDNSHREYRIVIPSNSEYSEVRIVYDFKLWLVKKIILYYTTPISVEEGGKKDKPRLVISYKHIDLDPTFSKSEFSIERFVKKVGDRYLGVGKYMGYKVMNQM